MSKPRIAIVGAGIGGASVAKLLQQAGYDTQVYDQADSFSRIGAGIQLGPNAIKVLRKIGIEDEIVAEGNQPDYWYSRDGATGEYMSRIKLGDAKERFGAPYVTIHRGDVHLMLIKQLDPTRLHYGKKLASVEERENDVRLVFEDGTDAVADIVIGADGVNSVIREHIIGVEEPAYHGWVGHRAIIPAERLEATGVDLSEFQDCVKWWVGERHMMVYYIKGDHSEYYYVTGAPQPEWVGEKAFTPSSREEMRKEFGDFTHPITKALIEATVDVKKWPLLERDPEPTWFQNRLVLLGDACHPLKPHMAQGAAMAIEDAAMLVRCFEALGAENYAAVFERYRDKRFARTSRVQTVSHSNTFLKSQEDPSWVYGYDVFTDPIEVTEENNA